LLRHQLPLVELKKSILLVLWLVLLMSTVLLLRLPVPVECSKLLPPPPPKMPKRPPPMPQLRPLPPPMPQKRPPLPPMPQKRPPPPLPLLLLRPLQLLISNLLKLLPSSTSKDLRLKPVHLHSRCLSLVFRKERLTNGCVRVPLFPHRTQLSEPR